MACRAFQVIVAMLGLTFDVAALSVLKPGLDVPAKQLTVDQTCLEGNREFVMNQLDDSFVANAGSLASSNTRADDRPITTGNVCVSLPVFEPVDFIEEIVNNFLFFTERSTKLALHFANQTEYDDASLERLGALASNRVALTKMRIFIRKVGGSILYAHLLNAKTLEETWPGHCKFYVMQASNMWWVRKGMELSVRTHQYAINGPKPGPPGCNDFPFYRQISNNLRVNGWGAPEGAFYPMEMIHNFNKDLDAYLKLTDQDINAVLLLRSMLEVFWLPTYAMTHVQNMTQLGHYHVCYRHMVQSNSNYGEDSVPINEVKDVAAGRFIINTIDNKNISSDGLYSVKRVNRNLNHPVTRFIIGLAR